jgi:hypothetical protein
MRWSEHGLHGENRLQRNFESSRGKRLEQAGGICTVSMRGVRHKVCLKIEGL